MKQQKGQQRLRFDRFVFRLGKCLEDLRSQGLLRLWREFVIVSRSRKELRLREKEWTAKEGAWSRANQDARTAEHASQLMGELEEARLASTRSTYEAEVAELQAEVANELQTAQRGYDEGLVEMRVTQEGLLLKEELESLRRKSEEERHLQIGESEGQLKEARQRYEEVLELWKQREDTELQLSETVKEYEVERQRLRQESEELHSEAEKERAENRLHRQRLQGAREERQPLLKALSTGSSSVETFWLRSDTLDLVFFSRS